LICIVGEIFCGGKSPGRKDGELSPDVNRQSAKKKVTRRPDSVGKDN